MQLLKQIVIILIAMLVLDGLWIGWFAKSLYLEQIGFLMRQHEGQMAPNWSGAIVVYIAMVAGIICFVIPKAQGNWLLAAGWGAIFGLVLYSVYDFTNYAIIANWPLKITLIDVAWGTFLCAVASALASKLA